MEGRDEVEQLLPARQLREGSERGAHRQQEWSLLTKPAQLAVTFLLEYDCGKSGDGVEVLSGGLSEARFWQTRFSSSEAVCTLAPDCERCKFLKR